MPEIEQPAVVEAHPTFDKTL